jgi:predicted dehydrogenase
MSNQQDEQLENLRELLRQHWNHCRHLESERAWFMNAFAVVVGGAMAFLIGMAVKDIDALADIKFFQVFIVFLAGLTFFGFFHTLRWTYAFECHRIKVNALAEIIWGESQSKARVPLDPTMDIPPMEIKPKFIKGFFRTRHWFSLFYFVILLGLIALSFLLGLPCWVWALAIAVCVIASYLGLFWYLSLKKIEKGKRKVVLEGCNGKWAQKHYLPVLTEKAAKGKIELWAVDIKANVEKGNKKVAEAWQTAQDLNKAYYINKEKDRRIYDELSDVDCVFVVTPDRHHCQIAEFWLDRLSANGKIFIEKPLDAKKEAGENLREKLGTEKRERVFAFDHYTARALPSMKPTPQPEEINKIELNILEANEIAPEEKDALDNGVIFDLFCHALALVHKVLNQDPTYTKLPAVKLEEVKAARYVNCPISGETFAWIESRVNDILIVSVVGKCVDSQDNKQMILFGPNGKSELNFIHYAPKRQHKLPLSSSEAVKGFLNKVMADKQPLSIPGVLSFDTAFDILTILDEAKKKIGKMPEYQCHETIAKILERFKK